MRSEWAGETSRYYIWLENNDCPHLVTENILSPFDSKGYLFELGSGDLMIRTLEGDMRADDGDWIIKGIKGEFYPCKPDIFESSYEAV